LPQIYFNDHTAIQPLPLEYKLEVLAKTKTETPPTTTTVGPTFTGWEEIQMQPVLWLQVIVHAKRLIPSDFTTTTMPLASIERKGIRKKRQEVGNYS